MVGTPNFNCNSHQQNITHASADVEMPCKIYDFFLNLEMILIKKCSYFKKYIKFDIN